MNSNDPDDYYPVVVVTPNQSIWDEALGTKQKFWIEQDGYRWLFKYARENTGEDWSEKLACEIAKAIGIPAAHIELATCDGRRGTLSRSFTDRDKNESLIHGNEILAGQVFGYDPNKKFGQSDHTLENIQLAIGKLFSGEEEQTVLKRLASYLVLDALIGNTDRHHENWGLFSRQSVINGKVRLKELSVAPTFDHASSLGRLLLDTKMQQYLADPQGVARYVRNGRGAIYLAAAGSRGENPLELVERAHQRYPHLFSGSLQDLRAIPLAPLLAMVDRVPPDRISAVAKQFVKAFLTYTYGQLCNLQT